MVDVSDRSPGESAMIALLPTSTEWSQLDMPHLTLVYAGLIKDHKTTAFNELAKDAAMLASLTPSIRLLVSGRETFGEEKNIDVFKFHYSTQILAMRRAVESWNASEYPFVPHVTIGPVGSYVEFVPKVIRFDRLLVVWGDEHLTFLLRG